jgi:hypothetical protein
MRGASWGLDNTVLFNANGPCECLMEASIAGGNPQAVVTRGNPRSPWMLPDGRHFLYQSRQAGQIHVVSRDGTVDRVVMDATSNAIFADGHLLFMRDDTLIAQPFNPSTLALTGTAVAVAHGVHTLLGEGPPPPRPTAATRTGVGLGETRVCSAPASGWLRSGTWAQHETRCRPMGVGQSEWRRVDGHT